LISEALSKTFGFWEFKKRSLSKKKRSFFLKETNFFKNKRSFFFFAVLLHCAKHSEKEALQKSKIFVCLSKTEGFCPTDRLALLAKRANEGKKSSIFVPLLSSQKALLFVQRTFGSLKTYGFLKKFFQFFQKNRVFLISFAFCSKNLRFFEKTTFF
jgi:hypothetical protein